MRVVIIGCGDIGVRCARLLLDAGHEVTGVRRNIAALPGWLNARSADVTNPASLGFLQDAQFDVIIYQVAAAGFTEEAYRQAYVQGLANVIEKSRPTAPRLLFVSSTGVYHQKDDGWVDETSETLPQKFNGQIMLEGEKLVAATAQGTTVRFSGIYGPGRTRLIDRVRSGEPGTDNDGYTNRIHVADCASALAHLALLDTDGETKLQRTYLASDSAPALRSEVFGFLAAELGVPLRGTEHGTDQQTKVTQSKAEQPQDGTQKRITGSKRCNNQRLLDSGYQFIYPDYRSGYRQVISAVDTTAM